MGAMGDKPFVSIKLLVLFLSLSVIACTEGPSSATGEYPPDPSHEELDTGGADQPSSTIATNPKAFDFSIDGKFVLLTMDEERLVELELQEGFLIIDEDIPVDEVQVIFFYDNGQRITEIFASVEDALALPIEVDQGDGNLVTQIGIRIISGDSGKTKLLDVGGDSKPHEIGDIKWPANGTKVAEFLEASEPDKVHEQESLAVGAELVEPEVDREDEVRVPEEVDDADYVRDYERK